MMRHLFLSPHLDDASLSAGGYIALLRNQGDEVLVQTFVTADAGAELPRSEFAEAIHKHWGLGDKPFLERRKEDVASCGVLGADFRHEALLDAIYRVGVDGSLLYPSIEAVFGAIAASQDRFPSDVRRLLDEEIERYQPDRVYAPIGIGGHVDHVIVSTTLQAAAEVNELEAWLYEDFPYVLGQYPQHRPDNLEAAQRRSVWAFERDVIVPIDLRKKVDGVLAYSSQLDEIFVDGSVAREAVERYACTIGQGEPAERYWLTRRASAR